MPRPAFCFALCTAVVGTAVGGTRASTEQPTFAAADSTLEGVFEGRTPCAPVALQFTGFPATGCEKIKWELTLYREAATGRPGTYRYRGTRASRAGDWSVTRGSAGDPAATVYELSYGDAVLYLLRIDENILLVMDTDRTLLVGDASWSYTLNRTDRR
jgi:hypothetical protein